MLSLPTPKKVTSLLCIIAIALSAVVFIQRNINGFYTKPIDFLIFSGTYKKFSQTGQLYIRNEDYERRYSPSAAVFKFPPPFLLSIAPYSSIEKAAVRHAFIRCLYIAIYLASLYLLYTACLKVYELSSHQRLQLISLLSVAASCTMPFYESIRWFLFEIPLLLFITLGIAAAENRKLRCLSGSLLGYAAAAKIYPAFLLGPAIFKKDRFALLGAAAAFILAFSLSIALFGIEEHIFYVINILPVISQEPVIDKFVNLNLEKFLYWIGAIDELTGTFFQLARLSILAGMAYLLLRYSSEFKQNTLLLFSLFVTSMFFCFPNYWPQYQIFLIIPFACLCVNYIKTQQIARLFLLSIAMSCLLIPDTAWRSVLDWDIARSTLDKSLIEIQASQSSVPTALYEHSFLSWIVFYLFEMRAILPLYLWASLALLVISEE